VPRHGAHIETEAPVARTPAAPEVIRHLGAAARSERWRGFVPTEPPGGPAAPDPDAVLDIALEALAFEHAHAEASRSRAVGLLTACGVLLALTAGLGSAAAQAAQKLSHLGATVTVSAAALTAMLLLASAVVSGLVFAPSNNTRTALDELREFTELRLRAVDKELLAKTALERLAAVRAANLTYRSWNHRARGLYIGALGVLGAQVLLIAVVHLFGI
jgi:hypothetical protein